jgi:parvulin-like peptidyl-prolyl isomerase
MAKKRQTTGLPKSAKKRETQEVEQSRRRLVKPLREYKSRAEREAAIQRWVIVGVVTAIVAVLIVLALAFVYDQFIVPSKVVATVNGEDISVGDYEDRIRLERVISIQRINSTLNDLVDLGLPVDQAGQQVTQFEPYATLWNELNFPDQLGLRVLNDMIADKLVEAKAAELGITVSQDDIDEQIRLVLGDVGGSVENIDPEATEEPTIEPTLTRTPFVSPTPSPVPTATPVPEITEESTPEVQPTITSTPFPTLEPTATFTTEELQEIVDDAVSELYDRALSDAGAKFEDVKRYFELRALRVAVGRELLDVSDTAVWVNPRHILVETEGEALDVIDALNNGESFAALARTVSVDPGSGAQGGELGWNQATLYVEPFANAVIDAPIGEIIGPIQSDFGYHIIQVSAREDRPLEEAEIEQNLLDDTNEYVQGLRDSADNDIEISDIWPDHIPQTPQFIYRPR